MFVAYHIIYRVSHCSRNAEKAVDKSRYYERKPEQFNLAKSTTCFAALGVSMLAGAAIAVSPTLADLPRLGAEAIRIALRMGVLAGQTSRCIEAREPSTPPESWTAAVKDLDEDTVRRELELFNTSTVSSHQRKREKKSYELTATSKIHCLATYSSVQSARTPSPSVALPQSYGNFSGFLSVSDRHATCICLSMGA